MINVLVPITDKAEKFNKLLANINGNQDIMVFVGIKKSQREQLDFLDSENITIVEFDDNSKREEILNALSLNLQEGEVMVLRKPITFEEFTKFYTCKEDIAVCKQRRSKFGGFFHKLWQKILKLCLGVKLYEGDTSVIKFNEDIGAVLSQTHDLSYATRVDRWKGLTTEAVETKGEQVKAERDNKTILMCSITAFVALVVALVTTICVCLFTKVQIIGGLLLVCLDVICLAVIFIMMVMVGFNCEVGKKHNKKANLAE